jgi:hypothetical protein
MLRQLPPYKAVKLRAQNKRPVVLRSEHKILLGVLADELVDQRDLLHD